MNLHRFALLALVTAFLLVFRFGEMQACTCRSSTVGESYAMADAIFIGKVVRLIPAYLDYLSPDYWFDSEGNLVESVDSSWTRSFFTIAEIQLVRKLKNLEVFPVVRVVTHSQESACGFPFALGGEYLVYAYTLRRDGQSIREFENRLPFSHFPGRDFSTNYCTRTTSWVDREVNKIDDFLVNGEH